MGAWMNIPISITVTWSILFGVHIFRKWAVGAVDVAAEGFGERLQRDEVQLGHLRFLSGRLKGYVKKDDKTFEIENRISSKVIKANSSERRGRKAMGLRPYERL